MNKWNQNGQVRSKWSSIIEGSIIGRFYNKMSNNKNSYNPIWSRIRLKWI